MKGRGTGSAEDSGEEVEPKVRVLVVGARSEIY